MGDIDRCQTGIKVDMIEYFGFYESWIASTGNGIEFSGTFGYIYRSDLSALGTGVTAVNGAQPNVGYTGFLDCQQAFSADGTSTLKHAHCHLDFVEL
jgi:hypothetical protein